MKAKELIQIYKTNNAFYIALKNEIEIIYEPLGNIYGYYNAINKSIHIDDNVQWHNREFTVAHLLFHYFNQNNDFAIWKNRHPNMKMWSKNEREGYKFAFDLLINSCELSKLSTLKDVCFARGLNENEFQNLKNEILENMQMDIESMNLHDFLIIFEK